MRLPTFMMYAQCMSQKKSYISALHNLDKVRRDRRIPRRGLQPYKRCPFEFLFQLKNDQSLLNLGFQMVEALAIGGGGTTVVGVVSDIRTVKVFGSGGGGRAGRSPVLSLEEE